MRFAMAKLSFTAPLHIGEVGLGLEEVSEFIRSDTLFSALVCAWAQLFGSDETDRLLAGFQTGRPPFLLASAFLYAGETVFLPLPKLPLPVLAGGVIGSEFYKAFKRARFVPAGVFADAAAGRPVDPAAVIAAQETYRGAFVRAELPRHAQDRVDDSAELFFCGQVRFAAGAGLHVLIEIRDEEIRPALQAGFNWLADTGLGGERSVGAGSFTVAWGELELELPAAGNAFATLSLCHPDAEMIAALGTSYYGVIERSGWAFSPLLKAQCRRRSVILLEEGSVLRVAPGAVRGRLLEVSPPEWPRSHHPILRYGYGLTVPVAVPALAEAV